MILFDHVTKKFGKHTGLNDISIQIPDGDFLFLVGPSGAGKTTFLRLIRRDMQPDSGKIMVNEWDITKMAKSKIPLLRRTVSMIFQDFKVLYDRTVFENIALALEISGTPKKEIASQVRSALDLVGLKHKEKSFPVQLSAGELQRVAIARSAVTKPRILLADEPTGNLDPKTGWDIIKVIADINKIGTTVIMATHNIDIVNSMKKRVLVMKDGSFQSDQKQGRYS